MMRDIFGRPTGLRSARDPWAVRRAPVQPAPLRSQLAPLRYREEQEVAEAPPSEPPPSPAAQLAEAEAELAASRGRLEREAVREREAEKLRLAGEMLPVLDDVDRSIAAARSDGTVKPALIEGFELVRDRLERVLQGYGLERIAAVGQRFDPAVHDAIALVQVDDPRDIGVVVDEIERGYRAGARVLRPARVRVGVAD